MMRSLDSYANCKARVLAGGSNAQMQFFVNDAKADIKTMAEFIRRIADLNPEAGEIGPGMLAQLVSDARRILE